MSNARLGAAEWVPQGADVAGLREAAQACRGCELYRDATQAVMGEGPEDASLMVLGEQPGDKEDLAGEPFVGPAGQLLDRALEEAGIPAGSVFRTNVVKHFRHSGTRGKQRLHKTPSTLHVAACGPWLVAELAAVRPRGAVVLGGTAGKALFGSTFRVGASRGHLLKWPDEAAVAHPPDWVLPTTHPSAILRSRHREQDLAALVADLRDATATAYAGDPNLAVEDGLRAELRSRGQDQLATNEAWVSQTAEAIRAGHSPMIG